MIINRKLTDHDAETHVVILDRGLPVHHVVKLVDLPAFKMNEAQETVGIFFDGSKAISLVDQIKTGKAEVLMED